MMKKVPKDCWSFIYIDVNTFRTDEDLEKEYVWLEDGYKLCIDLLGIDIHEVDSLTFTGI